VFTATGEYDRIRQIRVQPLVVNDFLADRVFQNAVGLPSFFFISKRREHPDYDEKGEPVKL
jgi:hypothetical protein